MTFDEWEKDGGDCEKFRMIIDDIAKRAKSLGIETLILYRVEDKLSNLSEYGMIRGCDFVVAAGLLTVGTDLIFETGGDEEMD
jgi:hypothetical protein